MTAAWHEHISSEATANLIRDAALRTFAAGGVEMTTLRQVAHEAGLSIGAVQHNFGTKGHLVEAVESYVRDALMTLFAPTQVTTTGASSIDESGDTVKRLLAEYPDVARYVARAMVDGTAFGSSVFDMLIELGADRWRRRAEQGLLATDIDLQMANVNSILIAVAGIALSPHLERHLSEGFTSEEFGRRWTSSVNRMLRDGYLRR